MTPVTVTNLIDQVRDQTDELSTVNLSDADILQALNRAQLHAVSILSKHYPDPYMDEQTLTLTSGTQEYDMPEDLFEDRVESISIDDNTRLWPVRRITYRDDHYYTTSARVARPDSYAIVGRKLRFYPTPTGTYNAKMWYMRSPETLVEPQGRLEYVDSGNNQILVDSIGSDLTSTMNALGSYVNVIDAQTGEVKATMQIKTISGNNITLKSAASGRRSTIYNKTIVYSIPSTVNVDDYVCLASGTCIPYFGEGINNFLIQYAVAEARRRLEDNPDMELRVLDDFRDRVIGQWSGREATQRVARRSTKWYGQIRRPWPRSQF